MRFFRLACLTAALAAFAAADARAECKAPDHIAQLGENLPHVAARIAQKQSLTIVAFGSSSTEGIGASSDLTTYPARLEVELKRHFPGIPVRVINRGIGGEDVSEMLARFDHDIVAEKPDLVVWQLGTNAILRDDGISPEQPLIMKGLARFKATAADVIMLDPQFAPKVLKDPDAVPMVKLIATIAKEQHIALFHRFDMMRYWHHDMGMPFETFLSKDLLHMNDFSYACTAQYLGAAIAQAARVTHAGTGNTHANVNTPVTPLASNAPLD